MYRDAKILIGKSDSQNVYIYPKMANRHGMIAGATGTGKTVTLKVLAESFSDCGVPVFLADIKGDLAGMCRSGALNDSLSERIDKLELAPFDFKAYPTNFWDIYGEKGMPLRTTVSEMGPLLLSRILGLNDTQTDIMTILFRIADDDGLLLIDTKDLLAMLQYVGENVKELSVKYGNIAKQSLGAIIRSVLALESEGGDKFFGEPAINVRDWIATDNNGRGMIQILACEKLILNPTMYATFMLWLMSELFETLPEVGDPEKPRMVFFFDEAHLLFDHAPKTLLDKIEQVVKLIRSKGVGIYFITQNPGDIPDGVLSQLGNKVQHALHAYTPAEQKKARAASQSFRVNPEFDTFKTLIELGTGEALISVLGEDGIPTIVEKCTILPPQSQMGSLDDDIRKSVIESCPLYFRYNEMVDRDSAYEFLSRKAILDEETARKAAEAEAAEKQHLKEEAEAEKQRIKEAEAAEKQRLKEEAAAEKQRIKEAEAAEKQRLKEEAAAEKQRLKEEEAARKAEEKAAAKKKSTVKSAVSSVAQTAAGTVGREVGNTLGKKLGGTFGKKLGGNLGASLGRGIFSTLFKLGK